jgi:hypothetical protein
LKSAFIRGKKISYNKNMADITIEINKNKYKIVINRDRWEKLAADLGLYNEEFIKSVKRGLRDYKKKRIYMIRINPRYYPRLSVER